MDSLIMETPDRERAILMQRAASAGAVTNFPGQTPDSKELLASHLHLQPQGKSSPMSASSDSFSSYIHKDAAIVQHRSSSPRADSGSQESGEGPSNLGSPRSRVQARLDAAAKVLDGHRRLPSFELPRPSTAAATPIRGGELPRAVDRRASRGPESAAVDVSQLRDRGSVSHQNGQSSFVPMAISALYHQPAHEGLARWEREGSMASASFNDSRDDDDKSELRGDDSKAEIRRRRRTRPDEANLLAQAYAENAFPDQETRQRLAERVGMTVRAVSVWFQNRRQAEKKRSGRYGGSGIVGGGSTSGASSTASSASEPHFASMAPSTAPSARSVPLASDFEPLAAVATDSGPTEPSRHPLTSTPRNKPARAPRTSLPTPIDLSQSNKENIPPWAVATAPGADGMQQAVKLEEEDISLVAMPRRSVSAAFRPASRDLRDLIGAPRADVRQVHAAAKPLQPLSRVASLSGASKAFGRVRSAPRMSLDEAADRHSSTFHASATDTAASNGARGGAGKDEISTILPPRNTLSRSGSASSLSLVTTAGGRASLGSPSTALTSNAPETGEKMTVSLNSRLPPTVTAALQRHGIISSVDPEKRADEIRAKMVWQRMESSSASSSDVDMLAAARGQSGAELKDGEEDEEKTLRMIANRRAAKAQASIRNGPTASTTAADARSAIQQQKPVPLSVAATAALGVDVPPNGEPQSQLISTPARLGLVRRVPSLDWAAGRDRSTSAALPQRTVSTPLVRSALGRVSTPRTTSPTKPVQRSLQHSMAKRATASAKRKSMGAPTTDAGLAKAPVPLHGAAVNRPLDQAAGSAELAAAAGRSLYTSTAARPNGFADRSSPVKQGRVMPDNDENVFGGGVAPSSSRNLPGSPKRRRVEAAELGRDQDRNSLNPLIKGTSDRVLGSPMYGSRGMMHPHSFPSMSHTAFLGTPRTLVSSPFNGPLSTRSERIGFRGTAGSPSATPAPRQQSMVPASARASFESPRGRPFQSARESSAREQRRPLGELAYAPTSRTPSRESTSSSNGGAGSHTSDEWAAGLVKDAAASRPAAPQRSILSATPSRILADRSNTSSLTMSAERMVSNRHDDSGFFGSDSEDENALGASTAASAAGRPKKMLPASATRWAKSRSSPVVPRKRKSGEAADDQHAAELLLGLGQRHEAQSQ